jgi:hypothetical protein
VLRRFDTFRVPIRSGILPLPYRQPLQFLNRDSRHDHPRDSRFS